MEENVDTILGIDTADTQKQHTPPPFPHQVATHSTAAEKVLNVLAIIILVIGGLAALGCLVYPLIERYAKIEYFLPPAIGIVFYTLFTWALLKLFVQIAKTLREINSKLK